MNNLTFPTPTTRCIHGDSCDIANASRSMPRCTPLLSLFTVSSASTGCNSKQHKNASRLRCKILNWMQNFGILRWPEEAVKSVQDTERAHDRHSLPGQLRVGLAAGPPGVHSEMHHTEPANSVQTKEVRCCATGTKRSMRQCLERKGNKTDF